MKFQDTEPPKDGRWFIGRYDCNCGFPGKAALVRWNPREHDGRIYEWEVIEFSLFFKELAEENAWPESRIWDWAPLPDREGNSA